MQHTWLGEQTGKSSTGGIKPWAINCPYEGGASLLNSSASTLDNCVSNDLLKKQGDKKGLKKESQRNFYYK